MGCQGLVLSKEAKSPQIGDIVELCSSTTEVSIRVARNMTLPTQSPPSLETDDQTESEMRAKCIGQRLHLESR